VGSRLREAALFLFGATADLSTISVALGIQIVSANPEGTTFTLHDVQTVLLKKHSRQLGHPR
jgi:hypothetical protein